MGMGRADVRVIATFTRATIPGRIPVVAARPAVAVFQLAPTPTVAPAVGGAAAPAAAAAAPAAAAAGAVGAVVTVITVATMARYQVKTAIESIKHEVVKECSTR